MSEKNTIKNKKIYRDKSVLDHEHIVLCREHYNPLGIIRSLGESGIRPVAIIIRDKKQFIGSSRYVSKAIYVENINEAVRILKCEYNNCEYKPFLYITDDYFLEYIDMHYNEFKESFIFTNAGENGRISYFMNKDNINKLAYKHGINVPNSTVVKRGELPKGLKYPIITKSIASTSGAWKADYYICNSENDLLDAYTKIKGETILLQEYIDRQGEFNIDGISVNKGKSVFLSMVTKYVYLLPGRYSTYMDVMNVNDDKLSHQIKNIIYEIGYEGIFDGEFMIGKDDKVYFLEINFRHNAFNYASTCAGMNDPYLWAKGMLEGYVSQDNTKVIPKGFRAMVESNDFKDRVLSRKIGIFSWVKDFLTCKCHFYFNIHDVKPFIRAYILKN